MIEKKGYRLTVACALTVAASFLFITFFSSSIIMIIVGEFLLGLPWGVFQATTLSYVSDLVPEKLRPFMSTYVNMCWVFGQFLASGAVKASLAIADDTWAFRIPIAVQWVWPPLLILLIAAGNAPESPFWLVRQGKVTQAERTAKRLTGNKFSFDPDGYISSLQTTNHAEKNECDSSISYLETFRGVNLRRTEIAVVANLTQQWSGSHLMFYSAKLFQMGGMPESMSFSFNLIMYSLAVIGVIGSWFLMKKLGRRTVWLAALSTFLALLVSIGTLGFYVDTYKEVPFIIGSLLLAFSLVYNLSIGPVCYALVAEVPSSRLKAKTAVISRNIYNLAGIFNLFMGPKMLENSSDAWGWGAKTAYFWAGMCFLCLVWAFFRMPETKNRGYAELEVLFSKNIPARKFAEMRVDQFERTVKDETGALVG